MELIGGYDPSTIFGQPADPADARADRASTPATDYPAFNEVHWSLPAEAVGVADTGGDHYASGGWSGGRPRGRVWAARTYPAATTIAAIFPGRPQRYFDTAFNDDYCRQHHLLDAEPPAELLTISTPAGRFAGRPLDPVRHSGRPGRRCGDGSGGRARPAHGC